VEVVWFDACLIYRSIQYRTFATKASAHFAKLICKTKRANVSYLRTLFGKDWESRVLAASIVRPAITVNSEESAWLLKRIFSFPALLGAILVAAVFVLGRGFQVDPDLWWHIKTGQNILAAHRWPTTDPYSFTASGNPWIAYEWLGEVLLGTVFALAGLLGLDALLIILGAAILIALYAYATLCSGNSKAGFATAAVLYPLVTQSLSLRPQMLGYLFVILTLIVLERFRQKKPRALWCLPPLFLIWVNTHGSFIVGLGVIFVYWVAGVKAFRLGEIEEQGWTPVERLRLSFVFLLCLAALAVTPYGTRLAVYPFDMAFSQPINVANIAEWQGMPFHIFIGKFFLILLLGFIVLQIAFSFKWRPAELALFVFGTMMACLHIRFVLLFVPFFTPILAAILSHWLPHYEKEKDKYILNALLMVGVLVAMSYYFPTLEYLQRSVANQFPVRAVEHIRQHPIPGPIFNSYGYGGYLIWALPKQKVFIDGRADLYERGGALADYFEAANLKPAAFAVLRGYRIQSCLLDRQNNEALATVLSNHPEWEKVYSDNVSMIFVRTTAVHSLELK